MKKSLVVLIMVVSFVVLLVCSGGNDVLNVNDFLKVIVEIKVGNII